MKINRLMATMQWEITLEERSLSDFSAEETRLRRAAVEAAGRAYAPYSGFQVGAAALLAGGGIVTGNNQENAAYPSGLCAERVALFYAGATYPRVAVRKLAIVAQDGAGIRERISPCGACRQVLLETEQRQGEPIEVWLCGREKAIVFPSAASLLPLCFGEADLKAEGAR